MSISFISVSALNIKINNHHPILLNINKIEQAISVDGKATVKTVIYFNDSDSISSIEVAETIQEIYTKLANASQGIAEDKTTIARFIQSPVANN